jgi:hypothetical protein
MNQIELKGNSSRLYFLDHLRMVMIFLVVLVHAGLVYDYALSSIWIVSDPAKSILIYRVFMVIDIFMMPVMFFISGYLTPASLKKKNGWGFVKSKTKRLMAPWLAAALILIPLYKVIFLYSRGLPQENFFSYFHFSGKMIMNQGWLWFLPVLFLFNMIYLLIDRVRKGKDPVSLKTAVPSVLVLGSAYSFLMMFFRLQGWTKTPVLDFQNERLFIYFLMFLLGTVCGKREIFSGTLSWKKPLIPALAGGILSAGIYSTFQWNFLVSGGSRFILSRTADYAVISLSFNLGMLLILYSLVTVFYTFLNRDYRILREPDRNSFGTYIIHFNVSGVIALLMLPWHITALWKWTVLTAGTFIISNIILSFYRRGKKWVLKQP